MPTLVSKVGLLFTTMPPEAYALRLDPFNAAEPNPLTTGALDSSLWELYSHRNHYHATISTLCKVFTEAFTKPGYAMEDFLDHTYATVSQRPLP